MGTNVSLIVLNKCSQWAVAKEFYSSHRFGEFLYMFSLTCCQNACSAFRRFLNTVTVPRVLWLPRAFQICLGDVLSGCAADLVDHTAVSLRPRPQRPGLDTSVQSPRVRLPLPFLVPPSCLCPQVTALIVAALLRPCLQSDVRVGHLPTDYSGVHSGRSLDGSLPYTAGLGQTVAGQHTLLLLVLNLKLFVCELKNKADKYR